MYVFPPRYTFGLTYHSHSFILLPGLQTQRRHASTSYTNANHASSRYASSSYESPHRRFGFGSDTTGSFRGPTHTPLARFNMMIASQLDRGKTGAVFTIVKRMKAEGIRPDRTTYNCLLQACAQESLYAEARGIFEDMVAMGIHPDRQTFHHLMRVSVYTSRTAFHYPVLSPTSYLLPRDESR